MFGAMQDTRLPFVFFVIKKCFFFTVTLSCLHLWLTEICKVYIMQTLDFSQIFFRFCRDSASAVKGEIVQSCLVKAVTDVQLNQNIPLYCIKQTSSRR